MTDKTKPEAMTADRLAEIERISLRPHYGKAGRHHVEELLAALKSAQDALAKVEKERDATFEAHAATRAQLEALALDALVHLSKAGICTPQDGYIQAPHCLGSNIDALAKERDEARGRVVAAEHNAETNLCLAEQRKRERDAAVSASAEFARKYAEAAEKLRAARESLDRRDQRLADARARVAELERDLSDSKALTTEHYDQAESAYSRGLEAGAADSAARVAELEGALAAATERNKALRERAWTAIATHDRFMESAHYSVTYRDSDSEALDVARLSQIGKLRALLAAPPEQAPGMETCAREVWRCSGCGEMLDSPPGTAWRWNGKVWEHRCPERDPQAGYEPARNFGPRLAPEQAPTRPSAVEAFKALGPFPLSVLACAQAPTRTDDGARRDVCGSTMFEDENGDPTAHCSRQAGHDGDHEMRDGDMTLARWTNHGDAARGTDDGPLPSELELLRDAHAQIKGQRDSLEWELRETQAHGAKLERERYDVRARALQEAISVVRSLREPHNSHVHAVEALKGLARAGAPPTPLGTDGEQAQTCALCGRTEADHILHRYRHMFRPRVSSTEGGETR